LNLAIPEQILLSAAISKILKVTEELDFVREVLYSKIVNLIKAN